MLLPSVFVTTYSKRGNSYRAPVFSVIATTQCSLTKVMRCSCLLVIIRTHQRRGGGRQLQKFNFRPRKYKWDLIQHTTISNSLCMLTDRSENWSSFLPDLIMCICKNCVTCYAFRMCLKSHLMNQYKVIKQPLTVDRPPCMPISRRWVGFLHNQSPTRNTKSATPQIQNFW